MKLSHWLAAILVTAPLAFISCKSNDKKKETEMKEPVLKEENITYTSGDASDSAVMDGYIVYDSNIEGNRPVVFVVHEWWGLNDYPKMRARELAKLGYIAMAVDIFGDGKHGDDPDAAGKLAAPFYQNPQLAKDRFDAAVKKLSGYSQADTTKMAGIGYCFGGGLLLNIARMGENLNGVVSFHGSLLGTPANKDLLKAKILVCHGAADPFVPQADVDMFKKQMDSIGAVYTFKAYPGATHAFTNPAATATGEKFKIPIKYDAAADSASWKDMKEFFGQLFK